MDPKGLMANFFSLYFPVGVNAKLQYEIMPGAAFGLFTINPDTGEVVTATTLDREVQDVLTFRGKGSLDGAEQASKQK